MKHWKLDIIGYWVIGAGAKLKRFWNLASGLQIVQKISEKYAPCLYLLLDQVWWVNELWFKRYIQKGTLSHVLILSWRHKFGKSWNGQKYKNLNISKMEHNFLRNKKILNLWVKQRIFRSQYFIAEITFKYYCP